MGDLWKAIVPLVPWAAGFGALLTVALIVGFAVAPKRTRKTVDYALNTARAILTLKKGDVAKPVEVPDFETALPFKAVPDPRVSGPSAVGGELPAPPARPDAKVGGV